jgi:hypothetical protein
LAERRWARAVADPEDEEKYLQPGKMLLWMDRMKCGLGVIKITFGPRGGCIFGDLNSMEGLSMLEHVKKRFQEVMFPIWLTLCL